MSIFLRLLVLLSVSHGAFAKTATEDAGSCAQFLSEQPSPVDYALSDLEGSFFDLVKKVQGVDDVPASRSEFFIKELLSMKAQLLNRTMSLLPMVQKAETLASIYQILDSLGIAPATYGLKLDKQFRVVTSWARPRSARYEKPEPEVLGPAIGFLPSTENRGRDLPDGLHRSIGFASHKITGEEPPKRLTGFIAREISPTNANSMSVFDLETKSTYLVDLRILTSFGAEIEGKRYLLDFNNEIHEWIVKVENLNNPTGKIGF